MAIALTLAVASALLSAGLVALVRRYALAHAILDHPNARSAHHAPMPRGGGLGIVLTVLAGLPALGAAGVLSTAALWALLPSGAALAAIGWWDDRHATPAWLRAMVHAAAAGWLLAWLGLPAWPDLPAGLRWALWMTGLVWAVNLFNFMDGLDGLAGAEAVFVALFSGTLLMAMDQPGPALAAVLIAAASLGFLYWNRPPARIFMGDVGSGFLGLMLGALLLLPSHGLPAFFWSFLILSALFWVDATLTLLARALRGERWYAAHSQHAYQHLARRWGSHRRVLLAATALNALWLLPLALLAWRAPAWGPGVLALAVSPLAGLWWRAGGGRP